MTTETQSPPAGATNGELIRWSFDVLNKRDVTPLRRFWSDSTVERFPDRTARGADDIASYFESVFAALPDFHLDIVSLAEQNDDVFVQWILTGTHTGAPFQGIEATGRPLSIDGIDHFVVRDGNVVSNFVVFDQMQFARAIGLMPPDGSAADRALKSAFNAKGKLVSLLRDR